MRTYFSISFFLFLALAGKGQTILANWVESSIMKAKTYNSSIERRTDTANGQIFRLNIQEIRQQLSAQMQEKAFRFFLPYPDGSLEEFIFWETLLMESPLREKYPEIKTWSGRGVNHPEETLKMDLTPQGLHAMILRPSAKTVFVDPILKGNDNFYVSYYHGDLKEEKGSFLCKAFTQKLKKKKASLRISSTPVPPVQSDGILRVYRLALAASGEYTVFNGGIVNALGAQISTVNRINGILERDLSIRFKLVGNNDRLIFTDSVTDPYSTNNINLMLGENQITVDSLIGLLNYDIGHVFYQTANPEGLAEPASVCNSSKAKGATGSMSPVGGGFDINYVIHEIGHQLGAHHTQNNDCSRWAPTAYEPGSGSTIMSYAGICAPNVQMNADPYFHGGSLMEILEFVSNPSQTCAVEIPLSNTLPEVSVEGSHYLIPPFAPFVLDASGVDADGDILTYCWEQFDNETDFAVPPLPLNRGGAQFRSLPPKISVHRYFPDLVDLANNTVSDWEVLVGIPRDFHFKVTVRDNAPEGGCFVFDSVKVTVVPGMSIFSVTTPGDEPLVWNIGNKENVTWNVAGTDTSAVNCQQMDILISYDGGKTYPDILETNVPNTGFASIMVPSVLTDSARLMVKCADNIFFNISTENFSIQDAVRVPDLDSLLVEAFPNPAKGGFWIKGNFPLSGSKVEIFTVLGQRLGYTSLRNDQPNLIWVDMEPVSAGVYFIKIHLDDFVGSLKVKIQ